MLILDWVYFCSLLAGVKHQNRLRMPISISLFLLLLPFSIPFLIAAAVIRSRARRRRSAGFFHPYTNDGGGGERVLWCAVRAVQEERPDLECVVYTGDDASPEGLSARALDRFGVRLPRAPGILEMIQGLTEVHGRKSSSYDFIWMVRLYKRKWIDERTYPHFTMIGQSLGSVYLSWEALTKLTPEIYFDTSGYAFTYPLARLFGCKVICYTHYPTISSDMISRVSQHNLMYNNDALVARSLWLSRCKIIYYTIFSWLYGLVGSYAHIAMVNSSWTRSHILNLWKIPDRIKRVYPPCDTSALQVLPLERPSGTLKLISVAQFRPEKAHMLQLEAFAHAVQRLGSDAPKPKLLFVGSCRYKDDRERLEKLRDKSKELCMDQYVEFHKDVSYRDLVQLLGSAVAGLHSMIDEHFGISVVEYMAAGAIPIAHNSAGPKMDIVLQEGGQPTGFLACNIEEYSDAIIKVLSMPEEERYEVASAARTRAQRFSEKRFYEDFKAAVNPILSCQRRV